MNLVLIVDSFGATYAMTSNSFMEADKKFKSYMSAASSATITLTADFSGIEHEDSILEDREQQVFRDATLCDLATATNFRLELSQTCPLGVNLVGRWVDDSNLKRLNDYTPPSPSVRLVWLSV